MNLVTIHRSKDVIRFKIAHGNDTWMVLGRTTPWDDDAVPPTTDYTITEVPEPICAMRTTVRWVYDDPAGIHSFIDGFGEEQKFSEAQTIQDVLDNDCTKLLLEAYGTGAQIGTNSFRAIGFVTDLVPSVGHENDTFLLAADVDSWGDLECIEYRTPIVMIPAALYGAKTLFEY